jgi:uncharacterized membrane protein YgdD (TMEM256/DUF423 family)
MAMPSSTASNPAYITVAALSGAIAVGLGAFGSHGLRHIVSPESLGVWKTAVEYQFIHTLALLLVALYPNNRAFSVTFWLWVLGMVLFSGSLYVMVITGQRALGMVTPVGGTMLILGWLLLAHRSMRRNRPTSTDSPETNVPS